MKNLFTLRYRQGTVGVQTALITASSLKKAEELGQWWCNERVNTRFVRVESAVIADEADIPNYDDTPKEPIEDRSTPEPEAVGAIAGAATGSSSLPKLPKK